MAYLGKDPSASKKGEGFHWRQNFQRVTAGGKIDYLDVCNISARYDNPVTDIDWANDVVRDVPPDKYERRYSTGSYAAPLALIARSWQETLEVPDALLEFVTRGTGPSKDDQSSGATAFDASWHWENPFADVPPFRYILEKFKPTSVLDIGCGIGAYLSLFRKLGTDIVFGVDGIPISATMLDDSSYREVDLTGKLSLNRKFDIVMCLEVAEHLPFAATTTLLESIRNHAQGLIVFSAAEPNQPGHGHINSLPIEEWLYRWRDLGWFPSLQETLVMRAISTLAWFKRNLIVLKYGKDEDSQATIDELTRIGSIAYTWHHTHPGVRTEILMDDMPVPPFGYAGEV